jgi:transcriptional regulator with XRE-family HTH domain
VLLGERIVVHREALGLTQAELAERVGRSDSWLQQLETGRRHLDRLSVRRKLAEALEVPYNELYGRDSLGVEPGDAEVEVLVEGLLSGDRDEALWALSDDPVVQRVVGVVLDRLQG